MTVFTERKIDKRSSLYGILEYHNISKTIILDNGYISRIKGLVAFKNDKSYYYNITIPISDRTYFYELKNRLKDKDTLNINSFLYTEDQRYHYIEENENCKKSISLMSRYGNTQEFEIKIKLWFKKYFTSF